MEYQNGVSTLVSANHRLLNLIQTEHNWTVCKEDTLNQANPRQVASAQGLLGVSISTRIMPGVISSLTLHQIMLTTSDGNPAMALKKIPGQIQKVSVCL